MAFFSSPAPAGSTRQKTKHSITAYVPISVKKIFFLVFIISAIVSCKKNKYKYELALDNKSEFVISLDSLTPPNTKMMQFFEEHADKSLIAFAMLNFDNQVINLHDGTGKNIKEIGLLNIDPTLSVVSGFYFINTDSLLLYSEKSRDMKLISCTNKFVPKVLFNLDSISNQKITQLDISVTSKTPIFYKNGSIYVVGRAMLNNDISKPQAKEVISAFSFDINTRKVNFISTFQKVWEERYWHHEQYYVNHTFLPHKNTVIYSLAMKDTVISYFIPSQTQAKSIIASDELGSEKDMIPEKISDPSTIGSYDDLEKYLDKPRYGELIFDKFRNVYYRFITKGDKRRITHIIICDSNFKKMGETELPENYLAGAGFFIVKEGIFLRKSESESGGEEKIFYDLFKLVKI